MKAKIIKTGEISSIEVLGLRVSDKAQALYGIDEVEILNEQMAELSTTEPDWEQRRWEASVAAMQGILGNHRLIDTHDANGTDWVSRESVLQADSLIEEFKKQK